MNKGKAHWPDLSKCQNALLSLLIKLLVPATDGILMNKPSQFEHACQEDQMNDKDQRGKQEPNYKKEPAGDMDHISLHDQHWNAPPCIYYPGKQNSNEQKVDQVQDIE
jgi:hypothetical protein